MNIVKREPLLHLVRRLVPDERLCALLQRIVSAQGAGRGLPIGALTSQHLANLYLGQLDHFVKDQREVRRYLRYMDDFVAFGEREELQALLAAVRDFLTRRLGLTLNEARSVVLPVRDGVPWLGLRVFGGYTRMQPERLRRLRRRCAQVIPLPPGLVRGLGAVICVVALLGPWGWLWRRASRHRPEPPAPVAVRPALVVLPAGSFQMGSPEAGPYGDERPRHGVRLTRRFALSETEVTQENYQRVMGKNPAYFHESGDLPVEQVSWMEAVSYCNKLSLLEGLEPCYVIRGDTVDWPKRLDCSGYRLPTEAEWEYAARADQSTEYAGSDKLDEVGWYKENAKGRTQLVASKLPNAWGLYDMSGNVWEWVWDGYGSYPAGAVTDPVGADKGRYRVLRGGAWIGVAVYARVAYRYGDVPGDRFRYVGFRVARSFPSSL